MEVFICICTVAIVYCNYAGEDDLERIVVEVEKIVDIQGLGLALGLRMNAILKIMEDDNNHVRQKRMILFQWLKRKDIIHRKHGQVPTWSLLAEAVEEENPATAENIRSKYCPKTT